MTGVFALFARTTPTTDNWCIFVALLAPHQKIPYAFSIRKSCNKICEKFYFNPVISFCMLYNMLIIPRANESSLTKKKLDFEPSPHYSLPNFPFFLLTLPSNEFGQT